MLKGDGEALECVDGRLTGVGEHLVALKGNGKR